MSISDDITKKSKRESESSVSEPQLENTARAGRACDDDYPDRIVHHNERPVRDRPADQPEPATTPAPVKDHGPAPETEENPFLEWDGEEGQIPHN